MKLLKKLICKLRGHAPDMRKLLRTYSSAAGLHVTCKRCGEPTFVQVFSGRGCEVRKEQFRPRSQ